MDVSKNQNQLPDIQENNSQILTDIQSLQKIEKDLFSSLEQNTSLTTKQQEEIIQKINDISKMRINLYQTLNGINDFFKTALSNSKGTLTEQTNAIDIVERELNAAKNRLQLLEEEKNNKIRLIQINNYYGQKYAEHSDLMKVVIMMLVPILILAILFNKGIIPSSVYYILLVIISIIGTIYLVNRFLSIISRDSMNYEAYDWSFDPNTAPKATTIDTTDPWASLSLGLTCIGDACCSPGLLYDSELNQCTIPTTESFVNNIFTKESNIFKKPDVNLGEENIDYNNTKSFINFPKF